MAREQWGTRVGVILAVAGSAVGLGNFLRFPGQAALNGGGSFMIPYFISLLLLGIPICWAEWIMGRHGGRFGFCSCPAIFGVLGRHPVWRYLGVMGLLIPLAVYMYYVYIEAWCLGYAWEYLSGGMAAAMGDDKAQYAAKAGEHFEKFTGQKEDGALFSGGLQPAVVFWIITFALNFFLVFRGLSKGIEAFCIRAMPIMALCALIVLGRVLTLDMVGATEPGRQLVDGLGYMWNPKPEPGKPWYTSLLDPQPWLAAAGQIFFSLSVGFGVIINYASYLKRKDDVVLSGLTASSTNEFFEVCLGGMITIPAAFMFLGAVGIAGSLNSTFSLGFKTLPVVFMYMPYGWFFGFLWFFMLFLAAITSSLSMLQPVIAFVEEALGIGRRASLTMLGMVTVAGCMFVIYFSKDLVALDTIDFWVGTALIFVLATIQVILFGWVFGADRGYKSGMEGAEMRLPTAFKFVIKYVTPTYLLTVFGFWCYNKLPEYIDTLQTNTVAMWSVCFVGAVAVFLLILIYLGGQRWGAELKGRQALAAEEA